MVDTVITPFNPDPSANFQFSAVLDGDTYTVICTWNTYAQRYYVNFYDLTGVEVLSCPLVGSPDDFNISLTAEHFDTTVIYRDSRAVFEIPGLPVTPAVIRPPAPPTPPPPPPPPLSGPLDDYAAYMMFCYGRERLLSSYGNGPLYRVRRSTDNVQADIHPAPDGTDTANLGAFVGSASAYLVTWYDQSGFGLNLTQATSSAQPLVVNAGTILPNFQPNGTTDGMATAGSVAGSAGMSFYFTGVPYPAVGTGLPLMFSINGSVKPIVMAYAILGGTNNGLLVGVGSANGNSYNQGLTDDSYALVVDTTQPTFITQANIYVDGGNPIFHGYTGVVNNTPIDGGRLCYASSLDFSTDYSQAQLRALVGYSVAHDLATATAINAILAAT